MQKVETVAGERRGDKRYGMQLQLRWKLVRRRREIDAGTGRTIDMSSGGILFQTDYDLTPGLNVELSIAWPVLLHNVAAMQLYVTGRIVRCSNGRTAIRTLTHEFRTAGVHSEQRKMLTNAARTSGMLIQMQNTPMRGVH